MRAIRQLAGACVGAIALGSGLPWETAHAQGASPGAPDIAAQVAAIDRIAWLLGEWEGETDWSRGAERSRVASWERVTRAAGGTALVVLGRHFDRQPDGARGKAVHDAAGLITFDTRTGRYRITSQTAAGHYGAFDGEVDAGPRSAAFVWRIVTPQGVVRHRIELDAERRWRERSVFCPGGDKPDAQCHAFLDMTLVRKGD